MKKFVKRILDQTGLLPTVERVYFNARAASLDVVRREIPLRQNGAPDGYPVPPADLIYDIIGCRWAAVYLDSGRRLVNDLEQALTRNGYALKDFGAILDFGCGCGRMLRHVLARTDANVYGTDYNPELAAWSAEHLAPATVKHNQLEPPLPFGDNSFDFAYARSVLTHLPEDLQIRWMRELNRVLKPGGVLYFTTHGRALARGLQHHQREALERGEVVETFSTRAGANLCSVYQYPAHVVRRLIDGYSLIDFVEGRPRKHLRQDVYLLKAE
ncbi:MAG: class I SAM-dependent methyltransferase [Bacteroidota bacterium]